MIKVITGVRRCGKSSVMHLISEELKQSGVSNENVFIDLGHRMGILGRLFNCRVAN